MIVDMLFSGPMADFFMNMLEKFYREKRDNIINDLNILLVFFKYFFRK